MRPAYSQHQPVKAEGGQLGTFDIDTPMPTSCMSSQQMAGDCFLDATLDTVQSLDGNSGSETDVFSGDLRHERPARRFRACDHEHVDHGGIGTWDHIVRQRLSSDCRKVVYGMRADTDEAAWWECYISGCVDPSPA